MVGVVLFRVWNANARTPGHCIQQLRWQLIVTVNYRKQQPGLGMSSARFHVMKAAHSGAHTPTHGGG